MEEDNFLRVELNREVRMPADHHHATEVPAVKSSKGMESQQGLTDFRYVVRGKRKQDIANPGYRGKKQKQNP